MPVTERLMALGDWSLRLRDDTPWTVRNSIKTPFTVLLVTEGRLPVVGLTDTIALASATYAGVVLRPGPQLELGGCGLEWFLSGSDSTFGAGFVASLSISSGSTLSSAVSTVLSGTGFTAGTVSSGTVAAYSGADVTRGMVLRQLAEQLQYEYRIKPNLTVDVGTAATLYGSSPSAVVVRQVGPREVVAPFGLQGTVANSWDWEDYASQAVVWTSSERATAGGASTYRGPGGALMTIYKGWEFTDAPAGAASGIATQLVSTVNRAYRTIEVTSDDYLVTSVVPCGGSVWVHDVDNGLVDTSNQVLFGGGVIHPVSARVVAATFPIEKGAGVYLRAHDGTNVTYTDLTDYVVWESPGVRMEVSTAAQFLAPRVSRILQDLWSPWQTYTPTFSAQTTPAAIGNGTTTGAFRRLGTSVEVRATVTMGTTTTYGAGTFTISLPSGVTGRTGVAYQLCPVLMVDSSTGNGHQGTGYVLGGGGVINIAVATSPWTYADNATPFAWANADSISLSMTLEVDP
jgi:hypothetical protein